MIKEMVLAARAQYLYLGIDFLIPHRTGRDFGVSRQTIITSQRARLNQEPHASGFQRGSVLALKSDDMENGNPTEGGDMDLDYSDSHVEDSLVMVLGSDGRVSLTGE